MVWYDKCVHILLIRHGQTNYNALNLCNGDPSIDVHLTKTGLEQVDELAHKLKDVNFEHIFVSEAKRTQHTAAIVNIYHTVPVTIDARLNDNRSGYEGKLRSDYDLAFNAASDKWTARLNGGESVADVHSRIQDFIDYLPTTGYHSVLIVTSEIVIQSFYGIINKLSYKESHDHTFDNCSYTVLEI